jgi:hypothetical protein
MSTSKLEDLLQRFDTDIGHFLLAIQTVRVVDVAAFQNIDGEAAELARLLKGQSLVPKSLLRVFRAAIKILRAEAPYVQGRLVEMADRLETIFDLILIGECLEDRVAGVPRII